MTQIYKLSVDAHFVVQPLQGMVMVMLLVILKTGFFNISTDISEVL
jgi:hypothetical protein